MFHIFEFLADFVINYDRHSSCDDFVDRLNRKYTVILLLVFVSIICSKQYIGDPLSCFCPAHFTGSHVEYTNNICWITNSFYVPTDTTFSYDTPTYSGRLPPPPPPPSATTNFYPFFNFHTSSSAPKIVAADMAEQPLLLEDHFSYLNTTHMKFARVDNLIPYYPFLLLIQAIFFYLPFFVWKNIVNRSAYDITTLVLLAQDSQYVDTQPQRDKLFRFLIRHIDRAKDYYSTKNDIKRGRYNYSVDLPSSAMSAQSNLKSSDVSDGVNLDLNSVQFRKKDRNDNSNYEIIRVRSMNSIVFYLNL
jgi:hypothetical protein